MQKKIYAIAIAVISMFSLSAFAQTPETCSQEKKAENIKLPDSENLRVHRVSDKQTYRKHPEMKRDIFKGIELSVEQKAKLEKLKAKETEKRLKNEAKQEANREKEMLKHKAEVKKILTEEQFQQFEANLKAMREHGKKCNGTPFDAEKQCAPVKECTNKDCTIKDCKEAKDCKDVKDCRGKHHKSGKHGKKGDKACAKSHPCESAGCEKK